MLQQKGVLAQHCLSVKPDGALGCIELEELGPAECSQAFLLFSLPPPTMLDLSTDLALNPDEAVSNLGYSKVPLDFTVKAPTGSLMTGSLNVPELVAFSRPRICLLDFQSGGSSIQKLHFHEYCSKSLLAS